MSDLERELSKHLVVRFTNAVTSMDICVVHLRRPIGSDGIEEQKNQCRALLRWAMRNLAAFEVVELGAVVLARAKEPISVGADDGPQHLP